MSHPRHVAPRRLRLSAVAGAALNLVGLTAMLALAGLAVGPRTGEYRTLTMLTASMAPAFPAGSVVVVTPEPVASLRPGQVITFHAPTPDRPVVTHRVVSVDRSGAKAVVTTKGDANVGNDLWQAIIDGQTVWRARAAVPYLGRAIAFLREPAAQLALTRVVPVVLLGWLLVAVWRTDDATG